jgi:hypothetical protein
VLHRRSKQEIATRDRATGQFLRSTNPVSFEESQNKNAREGTGASSSPGEPPFHEARALLMIGSAMAPARSSRPSTAMPPRCGFASTASRQPGRNRAAAAEDGRRRGRCAVLDRQGVGQRRDHGGEADDMSRAVSRWLEALQLDARLEKEEEARSGNHRIVFELDPELKCTPPARLERA